jgi:hypothetical protein
MSRISHLVLVAAVFALLGAGAAVWATNQRGPN